MLGVRRTAVMVLWGILAGPGPVVGTAQAQSAADSASRATRSFYDAIGSRNWDAAAALIHGERLGIVRRNVQSMVNGPSGNLVLTELLDLSSPAAFAGIPAAEVFARLFRTLERRIEPLARVISTNEVRIVGAVPEADEAHVVLRVSPYADGPRPSWVRVVTAKRDADGAWRLMDAEEITSVLTAVLGLPLR